MYNLIAESIPPSSNVSVQSTKSLVSSSQITSWNAQLRAPLSPCKQPGPVLTLVCIAVGHPQQTLLWWKIATARSFIFNRGIVTDTMPATPRMAYSAFHSIKAVVSQVGALRTGLQACGD